MTILSGVKLKLYPNKTQKQTIEQTFGNRRFVWNQFHNMQENRYKAMIDDYNSYKEQAEENGDKIINPIYIGDYDMKKVLTQLKKEYSWLHLSDATVLQKTLSNLDKAYKNFFKKPNQFEKPKFKSRKHRSQSFTGKANKSKSGKTSVYVAGPRYVYVPKLGFIKVSKTTRINGQIKEYTIIRESFGDYYISFQIIELGSPYAASVDYYRDSNNKPYIRLEYTTGCLGSSMRSKPLYGRHKDIDRFMREYEQFNDMVKAIRNIGY